MEMEGGAVGEAGGSWVGGRGCGDLGVLSALAPLLEEIAARQRREWGLQVRWRYGAIHGLVGVSQDFL